MTGAKCAKCQTMSEPTWVHCAKCGAQLHRHIEEPSLRPTAEGIFARIAILDARVRSLETEVQYSGCLQMIVIAVGTALLPVVPVGILILGFAISIEFTFFRPKKASIESAKSERAELERQLTLAGHKVPDPKA